MGEVNNNTEGNGVKRQEERYYCTKRWRGRVSRVKAERIFSKGR
jgi:hypothetical protein